MSESRWWARGRPFTWFRTCKLTGERTAVLEKRVVDALLAEDSSYTPAVAALEVAGNRETGRVLHLEDAMFHCEEQ